MKKGVTGGPPAYPTPDLLGRWGEKLHEGWGKPHTPAKSKTRPPKVTTTPPTPTSAAEKQAKKEERGLKKKNALRTSFKVDVRDFRILESIKLGFWHDPTKKK